MSQRVTRSRQNLQPQGQHQEHVKTKAVSNSQEERPRANAGKKRKSLATKGSNTLTSESDKAPRSQKPVKRAKIEKPKPEPDFNEAAKLAEKIQSKPNDSAEIPKKQQSKANPYNLTPGASPYPSYPQPTPSECHKVHQALAAVHGDVSAPKTIPAPNLQSSGCGEVPSVLDALVRTRLSANTNNSNSSRAFRGLVERFGVIKEGVGKGSVDWDKVRQVPQKEVFEAIKSGGLADIKSRDIQKILAMVYEENQEQAKKNSEALASKSSKTVLSLDHLHEMKDADAFDKLLGYPGIGPKTASCVLLFCMQRPSFAVDTHVFRLVSWLGWVPSDSAVRRMAKEAKVAATESGDGKKIKPPPPVSRNTAYAHLDIRIPDELKYPLHYLLIKHGKTCPSCAAKKDSKMREAWGDKKCPLVQFKNGKRGLATTEDDDETSTSVKDEPVSDEEKDTQIKGEDDDHAHGIPLKNQ